MVTDSHMPEVGSRVGAVLHIDNDTRTAHLLGFGTFEGLEVPPGDVGPMYVDQPNPKIKLDDGRIVWGCECWWGIAELVQADIKKAEAAGYAVVIDDIEAQRRGALEARGALLPVEIEQEFNRLLIGDTVDARLRDAIRKLLAPPCTGD